MIASSCSSWRMRPRAARSSADSWLRQDDIDQGRRPGRSTQESTELRAARGRIRQLEQEIAILRRAATWLDEEDGLPPKGRTR